MSKKHSPKGYIVVYDDGYGIVAPMAHNPACEGAIEAAAEYDAVALFDSREDARKAIQTSRKFAELRQLQGKIPNEDFLGKNYKNVKIRACI